MQEGKFLRLKEACWVVGVVAIHCVCPGKELWECYAIYLKNSRLSECKKSRKAKGSLHLKGCLVEGLTL